MAPSTRPIRFGTSVGDVRDGRKLRELARRAEGLGYSTFGLPDHFMMPLAPLVALQAVADATSTIRITQTVLAQDFRHPAVLAKELATLDLLSEGRLQIGIGAGWMRSEFEQAGMRFDAASVRIERLEEVITILRGLFTGEPFSFAGAHFTITDLVGSPVPVQQPAPPILVGGGGPKLLAAAARQADIIQVISQVAPEGQPARGAEFTAGAFRAKLALVQAAAGERFPEIELGTQLHHVCVTDDPEQEYAALAARMATTTDPTLDLVAELRASPVVAIGSLPEICDKLIEVRDTYGFSYFASPVYAKFDVLAAVIERLAGR